MSDTYNAPTPVQTIPFARPNDPDFTPGAIPNITIHARGGEKLDPFADFPSAPPKGNKAGTQASGNSNYAFDEFPSEPPPSSNEAPKKKFGMEDTWPVKMLKSAIGGASAIGDVATGKDVVQPSTPGLWSDEDEARQQATNSNIANRTTDLATFAAPAGVATRAGIGAAGVPISRVAPELMSSGQRAAATAAELSAPLPRGLASDSPFVQATTGAARQIPWAGQAITQRAGNTVKAAGDKIGEIVGELTPSAERSATDTTVRPALKDVITQNNAKTDSAYDALRQSINPDQAFPMPQTKQALQAVEQQRRRAGWANPKQGLENAWNLVNQGGGFNGAHRLRRDLREAGNGATPNPGYDAADFRMVTRALNGDIKNNLRKASIEPNISESLFNSAEITASKHIEQNKLLQQLLDAKGEGAIAKLLSTSKEKGGNVRLLAQLRGSMKPEAFEAVAGTLLNELGHQNASGAFSLSKFVTEWDKLSPQAKNVLFSKHHQTMINDIAGLGRHLKNADKYVNNSNTAGALILFELAKTGVETAAAVTMGILSPAAGAAAATGAAGAYALTRYLASPAKAAAMSAWTKAYKTVTFGAPSYAKIGVFNAATKNLANNLNLPVETVMKVIQSHVPAAAETNEQN